MDLTLIDTARGIIQHPADDLVRGAVGDRMVHEGGDILMLAPASHIDGGQLTVGLFALHGDMGFETRQRATCAEAESMNGPPGCQRHASRRKMCCLSALCLDLDLFKPCTRTDVMSDQRCCKPDAGLMPLGNLQLCSGSEADENRRMRRGR